MSPRIHLLPEDVISRIAAGEVVERPASVVKELVENSLDAGATRIAVSFEGAGRKSIMVSDNGCGMTVGEALLALQRHATSKISSFEDLNSIQSFGFRGEALPSLAAVSKLTMITRSREEEVGWEIHVEGGKVVSKTPVAREPGTTIEIRDIFYNTPARYKFLKSDITERGQIMKVLEEILFSSPHVAFEISLEKAKPLVFSALGKGWVSENMEGLRSRVGEAWGARWPRGLQTVISQNPHFSLTGFVTNQGFHQSTPRSQFLYVNRRPVQNRRLARSVYDAYLGQLPSLRHPGWVLFLSVDPAMVDVNVHPSKREVKLTHETEIYSFMNTAIKQALKGTVSAPVEVFSVAAEREGGVATNPEKPFDFSSRASAPPPVSRPPSSLLGALHQLSQPLFPPSSETPAISPMEMPRALELADLQDPDLQIDSQVQNTFLIAHTSSSILIFDQHAAAEKVAYEKLMANMNTAEPAVQMLLVPFTWEVSMSVHPAMEKNLEIFQKMGFVIEPFGGSTFLIKGVPASLGERFDLHSLLDGLSDVLLEPIDDRGGIERNITHRLAAMTACKASVKAGDKLDLREGRFIVQQLAQCEAPFTCPHGRPTVIRLPYNDLERRFRRS